MHASASQTALNAAYAAGQASAYAPTPNPLPRTPSQTFRAPFLSPASRPGSSVWAPPAYPLSSSTAASQPSHNGSASALALPPAPAPAPSTRLPAKLTKEEKPWLAGRAHRARASWWVTVMCMFAGAAGAALLCFFGVRDVAGKMFKDSDLCLVLNEGFNTLDLDKTWTREVQLGGFGNAEFQIASSFDNNSHVQDGNLYITPTLTSDWLGKDRVEGGELKVEDWPCTEAKTNATACAASGSAADRRVINPVMAARLSTKGKYSIKYGRVEVTAKLPRGDWLWPAIWMLPDEGAWPLAGEIDIMEARGNGPAYGAQGSNFARATIQYGPLPSLVARIFGWYGLKRTSFDQGFHTYGLEWDAEWMRFYVDTRVHALLKLDLGSAKEGFWARGGFPDTAQNGSSTIPITNPYAEANNAPFDKPFYLILSLAVGGTSGWFPDGVGDKPWFDGSGTAMYDFWQAKDKWYKTWPTGLQDRAFRIDSVKMWKKGRC
ncbi:glycoside hydrolase family 16 protein [Mycena rebaudengoi]|nr:glycoside hydrolase family 16 protein [Mycena rebaudengoi]